VRLLNNIKYLTRVSHTVVPVMGKRKIKIFFNIQISLWRNSRGNVFGKFNGEKRK
jgi:hypothetical protein